MDTEKSVSLIIMPEFACSMSDVKVAVEITRVYALQLALRGCEMECAK